MAKISVEPVMFRSKHRNHTIKSGELEFKFMNHFFRAETQAEIDHLRERAQKHNSPITELRPNERAKVTIDKVAKETKPEDLDVQTPSK
ncbi:MAG: hypothetical protein HQM09_15195 [Candidatus Riflebacteria bacterium]|nr:hypothetical protein [Candidatus Riflebacteria bacterium]